VGMYLKRKTFKKSVKALIGFIGDKSDALYVIFNQASLSSFFGYKDFVLKFPK